MSKVIYSFANFSNVLNYKYSACITSLSNNNMLTFDLFLGGKGGGIEVLNQCDL